MHDTDWLKTAFGGGFQVLVPLRPANADELADAFDEHGAPGPRP